MFATTVGTVTAVYNKQYRTTLILTLLITSVRGTAYIRSGLRKKPLRGGGNDVLLRIEIKSEGHVIYFVAPL